MRIRNGKQIQVYKLTFLKSGKIECYSHMVSIFKNHTHDELGCVKGSAWNSFYQNGYFENSLIKIEKLEAEIAVNVNNTYYDIRY